MRPAHFTALALMLVMPARGVPAPPPVQEFTAFSKYDDLAISPGGTLLAVTQREGEKQLLTIVDFPSMKSRRSFTFDKTIDVDEMRWVDEKHLLVQPARLSATLNAYKARTGEILRADVETGKTEMIYNWLMGKDQSGVRTSSRETQKLPAEIITTRTGVANEVLIQTSGGYIGEGLTNGAYRLNVLTGALRGVASSPLRGARFIEGANHDITVVYGQREDRDLVTYHLEGMGTEGQANKVWLAKAVASGESRRFYPVAWTGKRDEYYAVDNRDSPTLGIFVWNSQTNEQRLLYRHPQADMNVAARDPDGRAWLFSGNAPYPVYWYPDPNHPLARMHSTLAKQLPHDKVDVVSQTDDLSVAVVRISSGMRPPTYLIVDVSTSKPLLLMPTYPALKAVDLSPVKAIEFQARDGLKIWGYLTTPLGSDGKAGRSLPTVVMIHGGPYGVSDDIAYHFERQLFASRGYAVLQVNYRGSGGRGRVFERAGYGQWGRAMQDDVTDGVRWAIQDGTADAARICIYGGSYGAYSAMMGAVREPTLFKCAIGLSGVYDLPMLFDKGDIRLLQSGNLYLKEALGTDTQELKARSPAYNAKAIQAKVLLLHGAQDERAPFAHAEHMRKALIDAGNPPEWLVESGEEHGFFGPQNRADAYSKILDFLDRNIGH
jgi:dipeptidyl aminopeptidase/acylaminoacyl peptidase